MTSLLIPNVIHVYYGFPGDFQPDLLWPLLSEDERDRASQIRQKRDQRLYLATRASLRQLLAAYLDSESNSIQFQYRPNGKPFIEPDFGVQFSLAHSQEVFLLGFVKNAAIGVDVEHLGRSIDIEKLSEFLFSDRELSKFKSTDTAAHKEQFINCWTRKEAIFKAKGVGFSFPPNQLEVSFLKGEKPEVLSTSWSEQEKSEWFLESFEIADNYRGAIAVHGKIESITFQKVTNLNPFQSS